MDFAKMIRNIVDFRVNVRIHKGLSRNDVSTKRPKFGPPPPLLDVIVASLLRPPTPDLT